MKIVSIILGSSIVLCGLSGLAVSSQEIAEKLSPNCKVEYISQYGHEIQTFSNPCAFEIDSARAELAESPKKYQISNVPASELKQLEDDFASEGAKTSRILQPNGKYTVTAETSMKAKTAISKKLKISKADAKRIYNSLSVDEMSSPVSQDGVMTFTKRSASLTCSISVNTNTNKTVNAECSLGR